MKSFVLESRVFRRNGKKYNSVGNLFSTLARRQWIAFFYDIQRGVFWSLLCQLLPSDPFKLFALSFSILERMLITELSLPPNSHLFDSSFDVLNFPTVTWLPIDIHDFTDRVELSNSRSYGEIFQPLIIERETCCSRRFNLFSFPDIELKTYP